MKEFSLSSLLQVFSKYVEFFIVLCFVWGLKEMGELKFKLNEILLFIST